MDTSGVPAFLAVSGNDTKSLRWHLDYRFRCDATSPETSLGFSCVVDVGVSELDLLTVSGGFRPIGEPKRIPPEN